jgi:hypothetical protein
MAHSKGKANKVRVSKGRDSRDRVRVRAKVNRDKVRGRVKARDKATVKDKMATARVKVMGRAAAPKVRAHSQETPMVGREAHGAARPLTK